MYISNNTRVWARTPLAVQRTLWLTARDDDNDDDGDADDEHRNECRLLWIGKHSGMWCIERVKNMASNFFCENV